MSFTHTFEGTGRTVELERISFLVFQEMRSNYAAQNPEPQSPQKEIKVEGDESDFVDDVTNPAYVKAHAEWVIRDNHIQVLNMRQLYAKRGLRSEVDVQAVGNLKEDLPSLPVSIINEYEKYGLVFDQKYLDQYLYLWYVCVGTTEDYTNLITVMTTRTQPTQSLVSASASSF